MTQTLKYRVENAQKMTVAREVTVAGQTGTFNFEAALIEALPLDGEGNVCAGRSFSAELPVDALASYPEGSTLIVTIDVDPASIPEPAAEPDPAPAPEPAPAS